MAPKIFNKIKTATKAGCKDGLEFIVNHKGTIIRESAKAGALLGAGIVGGYYVGSIASGVPVIGPYLHDLVVPSLKAYIIWKASERMFDKKKGVYEGFMQTIAKWYSVSSAAGVLGVIANHAQSLLTATPKTASTLVDTITSIAKTVPSLGIAVASVAGVKFSYLLSYIPASVQRGTMDGAQTLGIGLVTYVAGLGAMELAGSPSGLEHLPEIAGGIASYVAAGNSRSAPIRWGSRIAAGAYTLAHAGQMPCLQDLSAWVAGKAGKSVKYVPQVIATAAAEAARLGVKYRKTIGSYCAKKAAGFTKNYVVPASGIAALGLGAYYGLPALGVSQDQAYLVSLYALALGSYGITRLSKNKLARFVGSAGALAAAAFAIDNTQILDFPGKAMAKVARDYTSDPTMLAGVRYMSNALGVAGLYAALLNATSPRSTAKPTSVP